MINFEDTRFQETEDYRTDLTEVFKQSDNNFNIAVTIKKLSTGEIKDDFLQYLGFSFLLTSTSN